MKPKNYIAVAKEVNAEWIRLYGGEIVSDPKGLCLRVRMMAEDRDCWVSNHKALTKAFNAREEKLKQILDDMEDVALGDPHPCVFDKIRHAMGYEIGDTYPWIKK